MGYRYSVEQAAIEAILFMEERDRARLLRAFEKLADFPEQTPDSTNIDAKGRRILGKFFDHWLVSYWIDSPVKVVVIIGCVRT